MASCRVLLDVFKGPPDIATALSQRQADGFLLVYTEAAHGVFPRADLMEVV